MTGRWSRWARFPLRLLLGFAFMYHGAPKLFLAAGHTMFVATLSGMGVPAAGSQGGR